MSRAFLGLPGEEKGAGAGKTQHLSDCACRLHADGLVATGRGGVAPAAAGAVDQCGPRSASGISAANPYECGLLGRAHFSRCPAQGAVVKKTIRSDRGTLEAGILHRRSCGRRYAQRAVADNRRAGNGHGAAEDEGAVAGQGHAQVVLVRAGPAEIPVVGVTGTGVDCQHGIRGVAADDGVGRRGVAAGHAEAADRLIDRIGGVAKLEHAASGAAGGTKHDAGRSREGADAGTGGGRAEHERSVFNARAAGIQVPPGQDLRPGPIHDQRHRALNRAGEIGRGRGGGQQHQGGRRGGAIGDRAAAAVVIGQRKSGLQGAVQVERPAACDLQRAGRRQPGTGSQHDVVEAVSRVGSRSAGKLDRMAAHAGNVERCAVGRPRIACRVSPVVDGNAV